MCIRDRVDNGRKAIDVFPVRSCLQYSISLIMVGHLSEVNCYLEYKQNDGVMEKEVTV